MKKPCFFLLKSFLIVLLFVCVFYDKSEAAVTAIKPLQVATPSEIEADFINGKGLCFKQGKSKRYYSFTVPERGWVCFVHQTGCSDVGGFNYTRKITMYHSQDMTNGQNCTDYSYKRYDDKVYEYFYIDAGTHYIEYSGCDDDYGYGYYFPNSSVFSYNYSKTNSSTGQVSIRLKYDGVSYMAKGSIPANNVVNDWSDKYDAISNANDVYTISKNGVYSFKMVISDSSWGKMNSYSFVLSVSDLKKKAVMNTIYAKDKTITAKTKAQTVNLNASALGGAKLSYSGKKAKVNSKGVVTVPANYVGCLLIKVTSAATSDYLQTTKDVRIYVQPLAPTLKKTTSNYKKTIYVNWSTVKICDGYEVWYSTRQDMKNAKCVVVKGNNKKSVEFKKTSGKTYYIRVRAYKKVNGNKNYSAYSNRKKVKVK